MKKKGLFVMAAACLLAATSCSEDEVVGGNVLSNNEIGLLTRVDSRAVETKITNLGKFTVNAFQAGDANYMNNVEYNTSDNGSSWTTAAGKFYWPVEGDLHLYGYAPAAPGKGGTFKIDKDAQTLTDFVPFETAAEQQDFVYAKSTGNNATNGTTGVELNFQHALTEISVAAKNSNTAYTVKVTGVKLGNVKTKGTFAFPSIENSAANWTLSDATADVGSYETTWSTATALTSSVSTLDEANVAFMLLPQQLEKSDKASEKAYLALKVNITMQGGKVIRDGWAYIGLNTNWEMGKHYTYTVDFSDGAGQDENGKQLISGKDIKLNVKVAPWDANAFTLPDNTLPLSTATANCLILDPTGTNVGKIDVATNINIFWSNPDVGDAANVLDKKSEWVAEVIWQDINARAINFCNADGNVISGDTYNGIGNQPLYVKAVGGKKGNVVVGVKKKGAGKDAYLWSWHLWITEEPQLVGGFMDRNLGATSANPTDGAKTRGLYYQFGRKDPFTGDIDRYDINGTSIGKTTVTSGKVTFAKAMQTPAVFYTYGNNSTYDWASPNNYTSKKWNDITDADGKSLFDPSPKGWRLPNRENFSNFSTTTFTWDNSNNGRTYEGNWFPAAGYRDSDDGSMNRVGSYGYSWSSSPYNGNNGYNLGFYSGNVDPSNNSNRAYGFSVRCVQE
ncbi:fimbrillin family protein [Segatella copri]|uniref:Fimbrillin family protein n=1 Tax=Segatella copri TaxID=165179 RepID=A0AA93BKK5_9BACT|nr:fimbrillin family protein [Segatella copri]RHA81912.1 fimbrillin family protein [Segatella copri]